MRQLAKSMLVFIGGIFLAVGLLAPVLANSGGDGSSPAAKGPMAEVHSAIEKQDYKGAIRRLNAVVRKDANNADAFNLLGYSHRKLGNFDKALAYYNNALAINPKHRGANEYLGELYLEISQLGKAKERLAVLDKACFFGCEEYTELKEAIAAYEAKQN